MSVAMSEPCQTECKYPMSSKTLSQCLEYRVLDRTSEVWSDRVPKNITKTSRTNIAQIREKKCLSIHQIECQNICQLECELQGQIECQNVCQVECHWHTAYH